MPKSGHVYSTAAASNTTTVAAANTTSNNNDNKEDENVPLSLSTYSSPFLLLTIFYLRLHSITLFSTSFTFLHR